MTTGFRTILLSMVVLLGACSSVPQPRSDCTQQYTFRNGLPCETFKQAHLSESYLGVTFSQRPEYSGKNDFWVLTWNGIEVTLPRTAYAHVYFFKGAEGQYSFRLATGNDFSISLLANNNDRYEDVFAVANLDDRTIETSAEGIAATRAMFGGPIRYSELMMRAYATTPADVTCCKEMYAAEMGHVVALIMKAIEGPDIVAAYEGVGRHSGWMTQSESDGRVAYALNIVPEKDAETVLHVIYDMPVQAPFQAAPFLLGSVESTAAAHPPAWLTALNRALREDANEAWLKYRDAAREAGLSPKSIQTVEKLLQASESK